MLFCYQDLIRPHSTCVVRSCTLPFGRARALFVWRCLCVFLGQICVLVVREDPRLRQQALANMLLQLESVH